MAHFVAFFISFQKIIPSKIPLGGQGLLVAQGLILLKKWGQSVLDPKEFKRIIRTSSISEFQPYHKHQVLRFFDPLHKHSSPET